MTTATRPAIVGSGNIGSALARLFARAGLEISIANTRGPESISELASSIGPGVHAVPLEEALASDLIFMAIPFGAVEQFGTSLPDWTGKTIVDTTNAHYTPNWEAIAGGRTSAQYVAEHLPGAKIVKAFNQLPANTTTPQTDIKILATGLGAGILIDATPRALPARPRAGQHRRALQLVATHLGRPTPARHPLPATPHHPRQRTRTAVGHHQPLSGASHQLPDGPGPTGQLVLGSDLRSLSAPPATGLDGHVLPRPPHAVRPGTAARGNLAGSTRTTRRCWISHRPRPAPIKAIGAEPGEIAVEGEPTPRVGTPKPMTVRRTPPPDAPTDTLLAAQATA